MRGYGASAKPEDVDAYNILHLVADVGAVLADAGAAPTLSATTGARRSHGPSHRWPPTRWTASQHCPSATQARSGAAWVDSTSTSSRSLGTCCSSSSL